METFEYSLTWRIDRFLPKVSVVLTTKRTGSLDIAKYCLVNQTFKDFEFLLVDELYEKRRGAVERYFNNSGIDLVHINASKEGHLKWRSWDFTVNRSFNLALAYARGELLMNIGDFWVLSPTALEATWKAWETWGRQGVNTLLCPSANHFLQVKPSFCQYLSERGAVWLKRGGIDYLDAPPDTYISIYTQDFNENPHIEKTADDPRILSMRVDGTMRDPRPDDPPAFRMCDAGSVGVFKYWHISSKAAWTLIVPVEDAIKVNGWDYDYCGKWGGEEEINLRMDCAFEHRYLCTVAALAYQLPHIEPVSWTVSRNIGFPGCNAEKTAQRMRESHFWADNPFNMAEERRKVREGNKTVIFDY